jgi:diguanylate cyclase (GGDEF)-like protein
MRPMNSFPYSTIDGFDLRAYERLADLLPRLLAKESLESLLEAIADIVDELIPCSGILIYEVRESDGTLAPLLSRGLLQRHERACADVRRAGLEGLAIAAAGALQPDSETSPVEAAIAVPLVVRGRPIGSLAVRRRGVGQLFADEELRFLARLADVAAVTLDNANTRATLAELAQTDALTGVLNRRGFLSAFERVLAQAERDESETSVLTVDVDGLKAINDRFGHSVGDEALVCVAETLLERTRGGDIVGRLGGDEFAVVLAKAGPLEAREIRDELEDSLRRARIEAAAAEFAPTATFGAASTRGAGISARQLLSRSDSDMYANKRRSGARHPPLRALPG